MWLDQNQLRTLGFRRKSAGYWNCVKRFGLKGEEHLSIFTRAEVGPLVEVGEFHVTFPIGENVHFYYHEVVEGDFAPDGHTSTAEILRIGLDGKSIRERADQIARSFLMRLGGRCLDRDPFR